jgi:cysteinyl-tRNA synthetase
MVVTENTLKRMETEREKATKRSRRDFAPWKKSRVGLFSYSVPRSEFPRRHPLWWNLHHDDQVAQAEAF